MKPPSEMSENIWINYQGRYSWCVWSENKKNYTEGYPIQNVKCLLLQNIRESLTSGA